MKILINTVCLSVAGVAGAFAAMGVWYVVMVQVVAPFAAWLNAA